MKFDFIEAEKAHYPVTLLCRVLDVSRSGFYASRGRLASASALRRDRLIEQIRIAFALHKSRCGSPRLSDELKAKGFACNRTYVAHLMRKSNLRAVRTKRFRPTAHQDQTVTPNILARQFIQSKPDQVWVGDITYVPTSQGWLYLAVLIDLYSRKVIGWQTSRYPDEALVRDALTSAIATRDPARGAIHHSDRGTQYTATAYRTLLADNGFQQSMSRRANCWDNAVAESFFKTLKVEMIYREKFATFNHAHRAIFSYIEGYYNRIRPHSHLQHVSPDVYERAA